MEVKPILIIRVPKRQWNETWANNIVGSKIGNDYWVTIVPTYKFDEIQMEVLNAKDMPELELKELKEKIDELCESL